MDFLCHSHTGVLALTGSLYGNRCNLSRVQWETWATLMTDPITVEISRKPRFIKNLEIITVYF